MNIEELYQKLIDKEFRDPATGSLFYPVYIYLYPAESEYKIREEIVDLEERLKRPNDFIQACVFDIFDLFIEYLKITTFGKQGTLYDLHIQIENEGNTQALSLLKDDANSKEFNSFLDTSIKRVLQLPSPMDKAYVILHGFGKIFPYLRVNKFLSHFEEYIKDQYKLIIFYPGVLKDNLSLFGILEDEHHYRSIYLINQEKAI